MAKLEKLVWQTLGECSIQIGQCPVREVVQFKDTMYGPYNHGWMFDGGVGMLFGILWMLLIWGLPLLLIIALLKYLFTTSPSSKREERPEIKAPPTPLDILKETYARGEISREEYRQKRDDILEK